LWGLAVYALLTIDPDPRRMASDSVGKNCGEIERIRADHRLLPKWNNAVIVQLSKNVKGIRLDYINMHQHGICLEPPPLKRETFPAIVFYL